MRGDWIAKRHWRLAGLTMLALWLALRPAEADTPQGQDIMVLTSERQVHVRHYAAPGTAPRPAIILIHGSGQPDPQARMFNLDVTAITAQGMDAYVVFYYSDADAKLMASPDHAVRGSTFEQRQMAWVQSFREIIGYVLNRRDSAKRIGLMGYSNGATLAITIAAYEPRVNAVVDYYGSFTRGIPFDRLPPLIALHGAADPVIPVTESQSLVSYLKSHGKIAELVVYPGAGHGFGGPQADDARKRALTFLNDRFWSN